MKTAPSHQMKLKWVKRRTLGNETSGHRPLMKSNGCDKEHLLPEGSETGHPEKSYSFAVISLICGHWPSLRPTEGTLSRVLAKRSTWNIRSRRCAATV